MTVPWPKLTVLLLEVVDEGDASLPTESPVIIDERFNQLDEIHSQLSQSILANCGPDGASSGGEFVIANQINNSNGSTNNSSNVSNSNENSNVSNSNESNLSNVSNDSGGNTNCYGSIVALDGAPSGSSQIDDSEMSPASHQQKRPGSEVISDDALDDSSSSSAIPVLVARAKKTKKPKKRLNTSAHLPARVANAVRLAVSQVSAKK